VGVRGQHSYEVHLVKHPDCEIRAISQYPDVSPAMLEGKHPADHAREYASAHGADYCADYQQILARDDIDVISLMCEPKAAPDLVEACCAAGKHIVRDKPICLDVDGADRIVEAVEGSPSKMLVTLGTRFAPNLRAVRDAVASGAIGDLLTATFTFLIPGGPLDGFTATPEYREAVGGGELTNFGSYAIDYLRWLADSPVATVHATTANCFYEDYREAEIEDMGTLTMRFDSGAIGTVVTGRTTTQHKPDSYFRLDVTGTRGSLTCKAPEEQVLLSNGAAQPITFSGTGIDAMIGAFIEAIHTDTPSPITARDGAELVRILDAGYRSAWEKRAVGLQRPRT